MVDPAKVVARARDRRLGPGFESGPRREWPGDFFFVQGADTQLGMVANYGDGSMVDQYPNITWEREIELCRQTVRLLNAMRPRPAFFVVCGDLVDAFPDKWPDLRAAQERDFFRVFSDLDPEIPLVCVCGNHDVGNRPTVESINLYKATWGDDYFSFWKNGVQFIVLNSQMYDDSSLVPELAAEQDAWLDGELARSKSAKHTVVFQHIPWFLRDPDEPDEYFNIASGTRLHMLNKLYEAGVRKIFCGHYHRNAGGWFRGDLELIVTSAIGCQMGDDAHGFRIVKVRKSGIEHAYQGLDECPTHINL